MLSSVFVGVWNANLMKNTVKNILKIKINN